MISITSFDLLIIIITLNSLPFNVAKDASIDQLLSPLFKTQLYPEPEKKKKRKTRRKFKRKNGWRLKLCKAGNGSGKGKRRARLSEMVRDLPPLQGYLHGNASLTY